MQEWLSGLSLAEYTPSTLAILAALLLFFGKLVPEKTVKKIEAFYKDALQVERENSTRTQESLRLLVEQNELVLEVLKKLPEPNEQTEPTEQTKPTPQPITTPTNDGNNDRTANETAVTAITCQHEEGDTHG